MTPFARVLLVGSSILLIGEAGQAAPPRRPELQYRTPRPLLELNSDPRRAPVKVVQAVIADEDNLELKDIDDFFVEGPEDGLQEGDEAGAQSSVGPEENAADSEADEDQGQTENRLNPLVFAALPPIRSVALDAPVSPGILPENYAAELFAKRAIENQSAGYRRVGSDQAGVHWVAPWVAYHPLYFEDVWLERHGYDYGHLQPVVSAAKFYGRIPFIAYMVGATPRSECVYSLGLGRPGDCTPHFFTLPKKSRRGALYQTAWITGAALLTP